MILVTGATGAIGGYLVRQLVAAGVPCTALVRDAAKGAALGCEFVVGDLDDPDSLAPAMRGVDRLLLNSGGAVPVAGEQPMVAQQRNAIDAARRAGVDAVVKVSVWGAHEGGKLAEGAHWQIERYLAESGLAAAILAPSGFMQNFSTGAGSFTDGGDLLGLHGGGAVSYIDCRDIAACAAALLTGPRPQGETYVLTGPEALTQARIAETLSAALGTTIRSVDLTPDEMTARLTAQGLPERFARDVVELWGEVAAGSLSTTTTTVRDLTGRDPHAFDRFVADNLDALRAARSA